MAEPANIEDGNTLLNEETRIVLPSNENHHGAIQAVPVPIARQVQEDGEITLLNEETQIVVPPLTESQVGLVQAGQIAQRLQEVVVTGGDFQGSNFGKQEITHVTEDYSNATITQHHHHDHHHHHYHEAAEKQPEASTSSTAIAQQEQEKATKVIDKDVQDFLHKVNESTRKKIKFDVRGNRKNLEKLKEYSQPRMMIIKMEGIKNTKDTGSTDDAATSADYKKKKETGTDVAEIKLEDLHVGLEEKFHVLLIGDAGEGKTLTVKQYIALFLSDSEQPQGKFKLVLYIPFSDIGTEKTTPFDLLITKQLGGLEPRLKTAGTKWFQSNSDGVLIAFDGMDQSKIPFEKSYPLTDDETPTDPAIIIANIMSGHIYNGMKILSTSRWHTFWSLGGNFKPDRIVALRGFSRDQVNDVFKQLLRSKADDILKHLIENAPGLLPLCSTPIILLNTALVLSQSKDVRPDTETEITVRTVIYLLTSENMQNEDEDFVVRLSALAYYGLKNGIYMFSNTDLQRHGLEMSCLQDFMKTDAKLMEGQSRVREKNKRCFFVHQTLQEAFGTLHICFNAKDDDILDDILNILDDPKMEKVCVFLFGILAHERTAKLVQDHISSVPSDLMRPVLHEILINKLHDGVIKDIRVCRVLQECDQHFVEKFSSRVNGFKMSYTALEPRDSYIVSSAISKLGHLEIVDLYNLELNPSTVVLLARSIGSIEHFKVGSLIGGNVALSDELREEHKPDVQKVLKKIEFDTIILNCTDDIVTVSLMCCKQKNMRWITTEHNNKLQDSTYKLIAAAGASSTLDISDNNLNENRVKQLLIGAKESDAKKLRRLNIDENKDIKPEGFRPLVDFAKEVHLQDLSMRDCNLNEECFRTMANQAEGKELQLERLDLRQDFPNPTKELLSCVCQLFHCMSALIDLWGWKFSEDDLMVLKAELQKASFKDLKVLTSYCCLTREQTDASESEEQRIESHTDSPSNAASHFPSQEIEEKGVTTSINMPSNETDAGHGTSKAKDHASQRVEGPSAVSDLQSQEEGETSSKDLLTQETGASARTSKSNSKSGIRGFFKKVFRRK